MPNIRLIAAAVVVAVLIVAGIWLYRQGGNNQRLNDATVTNQTQKRIDDAESSGPKSSGAVDERLRGGRF